MEKCWHGQDISPGPSYVMEDALNCELQYLALNVENFWLIMMAPYTFYLMAQIQKILLPANKID